MKRPPEQLDIFADSTAVVLRNDVITALLGRDPAAAHSALRVLDDSFPADPSRPALQTLILALESSSSSSSEASFADPGELARQRTTLAGPVTAAAHRVFGPVNGKAWLRPAWRALAARCDTAPFLPSHPDDHAAPLWLLADDGPRAAEATARIESWRRIPAPLGWMLEARARIDGLDAVWALLAELAWLAPRRLDAVLTRLDDPVLTRLRKTFEAAFDGAGDASDLAWFPAWLLIATPGLAPRLAPAQASNHTPAEQAMRTVLDLLTLERAGRQRELVQRRQTLRQLNESLYAIYLSTR